MNKTTASSWQVPLYLLQHLFQKSLRKLYLMKDIVLNNEHKKVRCFVWANRKLTQKWTAARSLIWHLEKKLFWPLRQNRFSLPAFKIKDCKSYTGADGGLVIGANQTSRLWHQIRSTLWYFDSIIKKYILPFAGMLCKMWNSVLYED